MGGAVAYSVRVTRPDRHRWWLVAGIVAVAALVVLNPPLAWAARRLVPLVVATGVVLAFAGIGSPVVRRLLPGSHPADDLLASVAVGLGLTGAWVFGLGLAGITGREWYAAWLAAGLVLAAGSCASRWRRLLAAPSPGGDIGWLAAAVALPFLLQLLPAVATPPVSTDSLEYHLLVPKIYLSWERIAHVPGLVEASYPSLVKYLYMPVLALAGDVACKGLHLLFGLLAAAALARLVAGAAPDANRLLAPALLLSTPVVATIMPLAWNDMLFVFLMVSALRWLVAYHDRPDAPGALRRMLVAGILVGLAAWTKYTVVMLLAALAPVFLAGLLRWRWRWRDVAAFALPVAAISLAVFAKNAAFVGNPFHPFLASLFPVAEWTAEADAYFHQAVRRWEIPEWRWWTPLALPYHVLLAPRLIDIHLGVVPLLLAPLLLAAGGGRPVRLLRWFVAFHVVAWLLFQTENRSLLTLVAVVYAVGGVGFERAVWSRRRLRVAAVGVLAAASAANLLLAVVNTYHLTEPLRYFVGLESRRAFLLREAHGQRTFDRLDRDPSVGRVLLVGFEGPYHLRREAFFSSFADPPAVEVFARGVAGPEELLARLASRGVTHVAIDVPRYRHLNEDGLFSWSAAERDAFETLLAELADPVAAFGEERIYRLR